MSRALCLIFFSSSLFLFSCKSSQIAVKASKKDIAVDSLFSELEKRMAFDWFSAKVKINYGDKTQSKSFTANIRMRKDSVLWISMTTIMGVEAVRMLFSRDSLFLIDRLNKSYQAGSLSIIEQYFPFSFNIGQLQSILSGEPILLSSDKLKVKLENDQVALTQESKKLKQTIMVNQQDHTISTQHLVDKQNNRSVSLIFEDYRTDGGKLFSFARNISLSDSNATSLSLKFSKVKWDEPQSFPFHIGDRYEEY